MLRGPCLAVPQPLGVSVPAGDVGLREGTQREPPGAAAGQRPPGSDTQSGDSLGMILSEFSKQKCSK